MSAEIVQIGIATPTDIRVTKMRGDARHYRTDPPLDGHEYVIVSAVVVEYGYGPETYIFPATATGTVADWGELSGSYRGGMDHAEALRGAGYVIDTTAEVTP
jgi:hypothetical protein